MFALTGKRALITGASRGGGAGIASALAAGGAFVLLAARNESALERIKSGIEAAGGHAETYCVDLSDRDGCRALAKHCGDIDILVNNAALTVIPFLPILDTDDEIWDRSFAMNVTAPLTLIKALAPAMVRRGSGVIINISSVGGQRPVPCHAAYASSKAALEMMSKCAALDLARSNVRVVAIGLGLTDTEALAESCGDATSVADLAGLMPINRTIKVTELGNFCRFLASDEAASITGVVLNIDGGQTAGQYWTMGAFETRSDN